MKQEQENLWGYLKRLRFVRQVIEERFPDQPEDSVRVLDVGCGNGSELALPLAQHGFRVTGINIHAPSIEYARQMAAGVSNLSYICGPVEVLNAQPYDVVILSEVLEHLREPQTLLKASLTHLSNNGIVIVTVPNGYGEFEVDSYLFERLRLQRIVELLARNRNRAMAATENHESGHVQFFTRRQLLTLFSQCSLLVFRQSSAGFLAGPLIGHTLARSQRFIEWNARVTDKLPFILASGWYFALRFNTDQNAEPVGRETV